MSTFDPGAIEAGPGWTRHNLSDHDDVASAGAQEMGDLAYNYRLGKWTTGAFFSIPTLAMAAGAGTAPPTPTLSIDSTDDRGTLSFGTGSAPPAQSAGQPLIVITFGTPMISPQQFTQPLVSAVAATATTIALNPALPLPTPGTVLTLTGGTTETVTVAANGVNYVTGVVTTSAAANAHAAGAAVNWSIAKLPYIDIQELTFSTRNLFIYPTAVSVTGFTLSYAGTTIAASQGAGVFQMTYKVEG